MLKPVILIIRDGWGINPGGREKRDENGDATLLARTPFHDQLYRDYPGGKLSASGVDVGLPEGQMGNSEVGHLNLGAGRIVYQDLTRINKAIADVDAVIHLAAIVGDQACDLNKERAIHTNYLAARNIAHSCAKNGKRLLFLSTCSVYGAKPGSVITESDSVLPLSIYAITKLAAEEAVQSSGCDHVILRLGTVYGYSPRMRFDLVINLMIAQALQLGSITVFGGDQFRPFIHVKDVVENSMRAVDSEATGVFNLGGSNHQICGVGKKIRDLTKCRINLFADIKDPRNYAVDSTKARQVLGAKFSRDIADAVDEIQFALKRGTLKSFDDPTYCNAEWLRRFRC